MLLGEGSQCSPIAFEIEASCGQQNGNWNIRLLCDLSCELESSAALLIEIEHLSYAVYGGDTRSERALEFNGQWSTKSSSWILFCFPAVVRLLEQRLGSSLSFICVRDWQSPLIALHLLHRICRFASRCSLHHACSIFPRVTLHCLVSSASHRICSIASIASHRVCRFALYSVSLLFFLISCVRISCCRNLRRAHSCASTC